MKVITTLLLVSLCLSFSHAKWTTISATIFPNQFFGLDVDLGNERTLPSCINGTSSDGQHLYECATHALLGWSLDICAYPVSEKGTLWSFNITAPNAPYINIFASQDIMGDSWGNGEFSATLPDYIYGPYVNGFFFNFSADKTWDDLTSLTLTLNGTLIQYQTPTEVTFYANPGCPTEPGNYAVKGSISDDMFYILDMDLDIFKKYEVNNWNFFFVSKTSVPMNFALQGTYNYTLSQ